MSAGKARSGYSLVEVVIAVGILAILGAGISSVTMMTSRIAYSNVYENTAHSVVQAYAEQIKSINYAEIRQALDNPAEYDIPTQSLSLGASQEAGDLKLDDPLIFGVPLEKDIIVDVEKKENGDLAERIMKLTVLATGNDMSQSADCWDAIEVTLDFEWEYSTSRGPSTHSSHVKLVKTNVTEY